MKVVIVGAGFAGLRLARKLNNKPGFGVVLVDKFNYHQFQPLFYQVATAALDASNISFPLRKAFQGTKNVHVRIEELKGVNTAEKKILTNAEDIHYDVLVLATGADTNFFGNQQVATNAFPMKSVVESLQLRHRLIQNFEDALLAKTADELQRLLNIVIVGGGPTGVEVAGALAEMKRYVLPKDYLNATLLRRKHFSGSILVAKNGTIVYERYVGYRDRRVKDSITANTPLQIASTGKTFTGGAVLKLVQEGKLNLNVATCKAASASESACINA